jgi:hypothetical protein
MKINTNHLVGAVIAFAVIFLTSVDAQVPSTKRTQPKWSYDEVTFAKGAGPESYMKLINDLSELGSELVTTHTDADGELHVIFRKPYVH